MNAPDTPNVAVRNRLLAVLPAEERARLLPRLEPVYPGMKEIIYDVNQPIEYVLFPNSGAFSMVTVMADGTAIEVGTVGNEGMIGLPVFLSAGSAPHRVFSQIPGESLRMPAGVFKTEIARGGMLPTVLQHYTQALFNHLAQSAACNRLHAVEQRCARWLLMTHDRAGTDDFPITQEFLAQMLGVRRATITELAGQLQRAGLIRYRRGHVMIVDRPGLETIACECYRITRAEFDRLLG